MKSKMLEMRVLKKLPHCPSCGAELQAFSGKSARPVPGNLAICDQCLGLNVFVSSETLEQRVATDTEAEEHVKGLRAQRQFGMAELLEKCLARRRSKPRA